MMHALKIALLALSGTASLDPASPALPQDDPRAAYDVRAYRLDVRVNPEGQEISGTVFVEFDVLADGLETIRLDAYEHLDIDYALFERGKKVRKNGDARGKPLYFKRHGDSVDFHLPRAARKGQCATLAVVFSGSPGEASPPSRGVRWTRTRDNRGRVDVCVQNLGAHYWFPCKASHFHPEDRADRLLVNVTVPDGLVGVSNGRLQARVEAGRDRAGRAWAEWRWEHEYPIATYGVCLNVGPYELVTESLKLPEHSEPLRFQYFVLPENLERARSQFSEVGEILTVFSRRFGPWPFPKSKVGIVESTFLTADQSTAIGYGSTYPKWLAEKGG